MRFRFYRIFWVALAILASIRTHPLFADPAAISLSTATAATVTSTAPALGSLSVSTESVSGFQTSSATIETPVESSSFKPAKIVKLTVQGNKNIKDRVILAEAKLRKNDIYTEEAARKDVQAIFALGYFDDVNVDVSDIPGGVQVIFKVSEKPLIKKIDFKGNKKLSSSKLRDSMTLKENDALDKNKLAIDVDKIISLYKDEGFAAAQVEPYTTSDATNHVTITLYVTEGTQVLVDAVNLEGVKSFPLKKIAKLMKTRRKKVFKQEQLSKDLEEITKFYKNHGYKNIKIADVKQDFNADKTRLTITLPIDEGPLLRFNNVTFSGNVILTSAKLMPNIQFKKGEVFNQEKLDASLSKLQDEYGSQGYIRVQIKPEFTQIISSGPVPAGIVDTNFAIQEGEVVYVEHIDIEGNTHTKDFVIRREIKLKEGDPFNSVLARKSVERLYNLGFLDNVDIDVQQPTSPNKADVIFTVTEGKPGMLSAGAGYSSVDHLIGTFQVQHTNFLGRGQRLNLQWQYGGRLNSLDIGWTEPWFMGKPVSFGLDIFDVKRIMQYSTDDSAYTMRSSGGSITVGPRFSDVYSLLFSYTYADRLRYDVDSNAPAGTQYAVLGSSDPSVSELGYINSNFTEQFIRDTRDNQFDPQHGTKLSFAITEGGLFPANAIKYYKPVLDGSIHIPLFWKFVLSLHGEFAEIKTYGDTNLTDIVDELFRVGGSDTVRGYELGHVGVLTGGQVMNVYNVEYKFPIAPDEHGRTLLQGVLFYDVGGSWNSLEDIRYRLNSSGFGLQQGIGFGIRFKTPVFPLRLDWGHALNPTPGDPSSQFYFNVGSLF